MQQLHQNLTFENVAAGGQATLPHNLNFGNDLLIPDLIFVQTPEAVVISATDTDVTVENQSTNIQTISIRLYCYHTIQRAFGAIGVKDLAPQPFVIYGGITAGGGGAAVQTNILWAANSLAMPSSLPNGTEYIPLAVGVSIQGDFIPGIDGNIVLGVRYALSAAEAQNIILELDALPVDIGDDPDPDLDTAITDSDVIASDNNTLEHEHTFPLTVTSTQRWRWRITRGADTNPADVRTFEFFWRPA